MSGDVDGYADAVATLRAGLLDSFEALRQLAEHVDHLERMAAAA